MRLVQRGHFPAGSLLGHDFHRLEMPAMAKGCLSFRDIRTVSGPEAITPVRSVRIRTGLSVTASGPPAIRPPRPR
jgi:hypothetical protein